MKIITVSVTEFAVPAPLKGSIEIYSGFGRGATVGTEIHQKIQAERSKEFENYESEIVIENSFEREGYTFKVQGRIDGFFSGKNPKIEEIKTSFNVYELMKRIRECGDDHPYILQLKTYGYFYYLQNKTMPDLNLHLVSSRNFEGADFTPSALDLDVYEAWLERRLAELVDEVKAAEKRALRRQKAAAKLQFPFETPRAGQVELIVTIEKGMGENHPMLIQAPTGLGKTVGVLYPTLKEAMNRGQKVVYITPKNSQHAVAEDAIERLQDKGANIRAMTLTAKSKMCFKNEPLCSPEFCEYAKDHYTKVAENKVIQTLAGKKRLSERVFKKIAEEHQVCPFEIQLEAVKDIDAVICDYNYVFAPRSALNAGPDLGQSGKPNLVIDEAHNLPSRAMDYYSPSLSTFTLEKMREECEGLPRKIKKEAKALIDDCIRVVKSCGPKDCTKACKIDPPAEVFHAQDVELRNFLSEYLNSDVEIQPRDVVMRLSFYWSEFTAALEFVSQDRKEFFTTFNPNPATVRITCCDASEMMKASYDEYSQVVAFSATLKPFDFFERLAGLTDRSLKTAEFTSPFPKDHRKLLIIPQISSKYSERTRSYPRIAETISKITELKRGNYFAFFPSFDFLEKTLNQFNPPAGFQVLKQDRYMKRDDIDAVIEQLKVHDSSNIVFAVQGGVFSEGVDYPGNMAIGAFIVGPPLPNFDLERENMRDYYEEKYSNGFDYAYTYPAMAKAVQAAGRVIRSETDHGLIVFMDNRFVDPRYTKAMPQDWFEENANELVSNKILSDISHFWDGRT